ncbi:hypothetical protein KR093_009831 [Drosophila rubida]|uniref:Uncharacterized protein n=1 Tax=Drosophila rubida TaxID=30044 RepID=A0AAD4K8P5_9MUSC|nr:hypothetical protein KR093_009831 [Drosophila rubida]
MVVNRKRSSKLNVRSNKWKSVPNKVRLPIIVDCDENLVPLVLDMVGMLTEQSSKSNKKPSVQPRPRQKARKRLPKKAKQSTQAPEPMEQSDETENAYGEDGAAKRRRRNAVRPPPRRKSLLYKNFVHFAEGLSRDTAGSRIRGATLLTPSPSPISLAPSASLHSLPSQSRSTGAAATTRPETTSQATSPTLSMLVDADADDDNVTSSSSGEVVTYRFELTPQLSRPPKKLRRRPSLRQTSEASSNSQLTLVEKPHLSQFAFPPTPRESGTAQAVQANPSKEAAGRNVDKESKSSH